MRVWVEQMKHSDGSFTFSLNYNVVAQDIGFFGNWVSAAKLYNITYTLKYTTFATGTVTKSGAISLTNQTGSTAILFDGLSGPIISVSVTGQRFGGSNGISVTFKH
jgi:hypothetical protein